MSRLTRLVLFARLAILGSLGAASLLALDLTTLQPQGYVSDFAGVVDPATKADLERYCKKVEDSTQAQIALVTLSTLDGEAVEDVANTLFRRWGIGKKGTNEGVLLLLAIQDRRSRLEVGYGLEPVLPDGYVGSILRGIRPSLRENNYGEALSTAAQMVGSRIAQSKNVSLQDAPQRQRQPEPESGFPWGFVIFVIIMIFVLSRSGGRRGGGGGGFWPGVILGNAMSSNWRVGSGGGFGGYDSGGGFGGFGGGDSGGGGASSDW